MNTTDLQDAASPEDVADILRRAADHFRDSRIELQAAWQDDNAGIVWEKLATRLESCAAACEKTVERWS